MKTMRKVISIMLVVMIILSIAVSASAETWRTGCFANNSWSSSHRVYLNNSRKSATVNIYTYDAADRKSSGKFSIYITTPESRSFGYTISGKTSGYALKLDYGYSQYDIQIKRYGTGSANVAACHYWGYRGNGNVSWIN